MSSFNRGEWSEIYAIICMLLCPDLSVGNSDLEEITNELYSLKKIKIDNPSQKGIIEYCLNHKNDVEVLYDNKFDSLISQLELMENKHRIYQAIEHAPIGNGAFIIEGIDGLLTKLTKGQTIKSKSFNKEDLEAIVLDKRIGKDACLKYSIKSSLGSPATLLNASMRTNFLYSISGLDAKYIKKINSINTSTKLLDRINFIINHGGTIKFEKVCDETLNYNLKMIDSNMPTYLANVLLNSYVSGEKNLLSLFMNSNDFDDKNFALKKLGDLLEGISFGFFPSIKWDGINKVNGGLVLVKNNGNVIILDLIYYREEVVKYLMNETKLDSPSTKRYNMLNLYQLMDDEKIYFTLNLQIRYKK